MGERCLIDCGVGDKRTRSAFGRGDERLEAGFGEDGWDSGGTRGNEGADGVGNGVSRKYAGFYPWCCRCVDSLLRLKLGCL